MKMDNGGDKQNGDEVSKNITIFLFITALLANLR